MIEFSSCKAAIQSCIGDRRFAVAHLYNDELPMDMHIHDCYEIYYSISGGRQFLIDKSFYSIQPGDIFFINQYESHCLTQIDKTVHERIVLSVHPDYLKGLSSMDTNLDYCFGFRSVISPHKLTLEPEDQKRFLYYIHKIVSASGFGSDILEQTSFMEMMVLLNRLFHRIDQTDIVEPMMTFHTQVYEILTYINQNIRNSLTIDELSGHFYLSSSYLCRIFKATTGTTINKYITAKRIALSKALLSEGCSVNEACERCGFHDYSNFLKAFTKAVGISPKKYAQFNA